MQLQVKEMIVKMFRRTNDVPPGFLYRFRCGINKNHCLLPMERARDSDDDTRDRMLFAAADVQTGEFTVLTIVGQDTHWWCIEHMSTNSRVQGATLVRDILLPVANSYGIYRIYVEAYHDSEKELSFWQNIGFRGTAFHKRKGGDRIRMEWTKAKKREGRYDKRVKRALPPKTE